MTFKSLSNIADISDISDISFLSFKYVILIIFMYIKVKCQIIKMDEYILIDVELIIV